MHAIYQTETGMVKYYKIRIIGNRKFPKCGNNKTSMTIKGCARYIFANLFCNSKGEHF